MQDLHISVGRKIVLHRPSSMFPVSFCQPFYFPMLCNRHLLCFSPVYSPCPQSKSQSLSTFKFHSLSPAQSSSGVSPSTLFFWSTPNSSRSLYNIYFLLLEHSLCSSSLFSLPVHNSRLQHLTRDSVSTLPDAPDFFTGPILFFNETTFIYSSSHLPILQA